MGNNKSDSQYMQEVVLQVFKTKAGHNLVKDYFTIACHEVRQPDKVSLKDLFDVKDMDCLAWHGVVVCKKNDAGNAPKVDTWLRNGYVRFLHNQALKEIFWETTIE